MLKYLLIAIGLLPQLCANAQNNDSLFAVRKGASWAIKYTIKPGESMHMLAKRFYLSDGVIEYANEDMKKKPVAGMMINVPVTPENYVTSKQTIDMSNLRELYYAVGPKEDIGLISTYAGVTKASMRSWNNLKGNTLAPGQVLFVGWVKVIPFDTTNPANETVYPVIKKKVSGTDTVKVIVLGGLDTVYNRQTTNGLNVLTEKGTAVFFDKAGKSGVYVAFHNSTPRGTVIKVHNPGTARTIYVKVLGPIPKTKLYANSIIGISSAAKEALGVSDTKAWCELSYPAN